MTKVSVNFHERRCFTDPGVLLPFVQSYIAYLTARGHAPLTVTQYSDCARHFAAWLCQSDIALADVGDGVIEQFARHRCQCSGRRQPRYVSTDYVNRVRQFVRFLAETGVARPPAPRTAKVIDKRKRMRVCVPFTGAQARLNGRVRARVLGRVERQAYGGFYRRLWATRWRRRSSDRLRANVSSGVGRPEAPIVRLRRGLSPIFQGTGRTMGVSCRSRDKAASGRTVGMIGVWIGAIKALVAVQGIVGATASDGRSRNAGSGVAMARPGGRRKARAPR